MTPTIPQGMKGLMIPALPGYLPLGVALTIARAFDPTPLLPPARTGAFGEPWVRGCCSQILTDAHVWPDTMQERYTRDDYGGGLVAESMHRRHRDRAIECVNFCTGERIPHPFTLTDVLDLFRVAVNGGYIGDGSHPYREHHLRGVAILARRVRIESR